MTYPASSADYPRTEWLIDGTWTDVSGDVRGPGGTSGPVITRGGSEGQGRVSACTSVFTLDQRSGKYSNRNPSSAYYGLIPRGTQVRHIAGTPDTHLFAPYNDLSDFNEARTADKAVLDITGDIEIRCDIWPHTWRPDSTGSGVDWMLLASKYAFASGDQRSWLLYIQTDGALRLIWSPDGTSANAIAVNSTATVPATSTRLSIKVTLDVNNGAAGNDVKFWTASSIDGTYTQLGSTVTTAGVTSIFSSSADLCVGTGSDSPGISGVPFGGRFYEFRLYSGIGGTLRANPVFSSQTVGTTSFSDGLGTPNTWTLAGDARITSDRIRFHGELASLGQAWDSSGNDVYAPVRAAGMLQRLTKPGSPLRSPMYRQYSQYSSLVGYWPMEDASTATTLANVAPGGRPAQFSGCTLGVSGGTAETLAGAASSVQFNSTTSQIIGNCVTATSGTIFLMFFMKLSALPAANRTVLLLYTTGTARRIEIAVGPTNWNFQFFAADGTSIVSHGTAHSSTTPTGWVGVNLLLSTNGGNVDWYARWHNAGDGTTFFGIGPNSLGAGTVGRATTWRLTARDESTYADAQFGHLLLASADLGFVTTPVALAHDAYVGETAGDRVARLCTEEGVSSEIIGLAEQSAAMGIQQPRTLTDLLFECADTDLGMLGECRDRLAVSYRTRHDLEARRDVTLDYSAAVLSQSPLPTEDDLLAANDVTASRTDGSSARAVLESGSMSTADPPDGIGPRLKSVSVNTETDEQLEDVAGWLLNLGSVDEARFPQLQVGMHRTQITGDSSLAVKLRALDCGDTALLTDLPSPMPPDDVPLIVHGYTETLFKNLWEITYNTAPASPYRTGVYDYDNGCGEYARYDTSGSTLNTSVNSSATTIILDSADADDTWTTDAAMYPFNITMGGEEITLNNAPGATSPQTFTGCTRSVNGVSKSHTAGAAASLAKSFRWA